jgi:hypothetical protein
MKNISEKPAREFWIHWPPFVKDPLGQVFNILRMVYDHKHDEDSIHVIEYSAIEECQAMLERMAEALDKVTEELDVLNIHWPDGVEEFLSDYHKWKGGKGEHNKRKN